MEPDSGFIDAVDTLEMARDAAEAAGAPALPFSGPATAASVTERAGLTLQAGLQTFSYDVHVKLGMEVGAGVLHAYGKG